ncbi:hypothetical protein DSM21852_25490 [Methylocystis bryophila]|nr:hypothetical protein DSM21852_25490 [Methylocystis bryophila]
MWSTTGGDPPLGGRGRLLWETPKKLELVMEESFGRDKELGAKAVVTEEFRGTMRRC